MSDRAKVVDELGRLQGLMEREQAALKARLAKRLARVETLEAEVLSWMDKSPAEEPGCFAGSKFVAFVSAKGNQSRVKDLRAVQARLGDDSFYSNASIALGTLRGLLAKHEHDAYILTERTGPRTVSVSKRK